jgi:hypothetical protein
METILKTNDYEEIGKYVDIKKKMLAAIVTDNDGLQTYCIIRNENVRQENAYFKSIIRYLLGTGLFKEISSSQEFIKEKDLLIKFPMYVMTEDIDNFIEEE